MLVCFFTLAGLGSSQMSQLKLSTFSKTGADVYQHPKASSVTSLGQRMKKRGTMSMMLQNVTQNTTSDFLYTSRSPGERPRHAETRETASFVVMDTQQEADLFRTEWSEEDNGGDEEAEHQADHNHDHGHD